MEAHLQVASHMECEKSDWPDYKVNTWQVQVQNVPQQRDGYGTRHRALWIGYLQYA